MKYQLIARYVSETLWSITPGKLAELLSVLAYHAAGHTFTPEEIAARIGDGRAASSAPAGGGVAVIPIRGVIANRIGGIKQASGGASAEAIGQMVSRAAADPSVGTLLYDIDSPGGTVPGIQELAAQMFALRGEKRQVAHVNDCACSAAYWLAAQCDEIVSVPSGTVGSIGVFCAHNDLSGALEQAGVKVTLISAGKFKTEGNPFEPLSDEAKAIVQARVDAAYAQFVRDVARGRGVTPAAVRSGYGEGRTLTAPDAKAAGVVDRIATFSDTVARLVGGRGGGAPALPGDRADVSTPPLDDGHTPTAPDDTAIRRYRVR